MGLQDFPYCFDEKSHKSVNKKLVMFSLQKGTRFCVCNPAKAFIIVQSQVIINNQNIPNSGVVPGASKKNKMVALLLCIFLGVLGVHRFYVGKIGTGLLYLFTGGLFGIGWIIDIILIAVGSFKDQFNLPLRQ